MKSLLAIHQSDAALDRARPFIDLAKEQEAHLDLIVLGILQTVPATAVPGAVDFYFDGSNNEVIDESKQRVSELEALLQSEQVAAAVTMECREFSVIEDTVPGYAMFSDAAVFQNRTILVDDANARCFNGVLLKSGRPVLLLDSENRLPPKIDKVLFAWNGEPESAKAMHHAIDWLSDGASVHVTAINPNDYRMGPNAGDDVATYLARQKLNVTVDRLPSGGQDVSDVLLQHATDIKADLLVMGAYGHSRFREWLLGGTTRDILAKSDIPVLMAK